MSISKNVGQMANYLTKLRTDPKYSHVKAHMETTLERIPVAGNAMVKVLQSGKQLIRRGIYKSTMFEEMGFQYIGPIDGHDVDMLTHADEPAGAVPSVFLHIVTQKGKGPESRRGKPRRVSRGIVHRFESFDRPELSPKDSFSSTFGCALADLGDDEPRVCGITAAMKYGTGLNFFKNRHPGRFFDVGMAEEHADQLCGGPCQPGAFARGCDLLYFFQRAYDQIIHDVSLMQLDVLSL